MRDWVAGVMLVLGTLLVLAGAAVVVLKALGASPAGEPAEQAAAQQPRDSAAQQPPDSAAQQPPGSTATGRAFGLARRIPAAERLICWGIILLVLAAIAAGAMAFGLSANAGTK